MRTMTMRRSMIAALAAVALLSLMAGQTTAADNTNRLTADQVRDIFVGREWGQGVGIFMFSKDGTYRYDDSSMSARGTWQIANNGVLCTKNSGTGRRTCYTFYRDGDGYRYWHDRSARYWPAYLR
ncbi:Protein of unknown function [Roseovarius azorensis]|uniref:Uncharacterized protein n=1 Tax=Roseovarius azorensis TaxID=1287727 RepID=A0A1H7RJ93_9RHOB|nr:DUF995 domain-containing protein [Roseovarius azorensis]SEL60311.1 Protein of unknown function [Roseovarius azorensis]